MVPSWTITLSYLAYAAMLAIGAACWLTVLFDHIVYARVDAQLLDPRWLDFSKPLYRWARPAIWTSLACATVAFAVAALPAEGELAGSHKAYQLRAGAVALCLVGLLWLTRGRMGEFDADVGAVLVFAWLLWILATGWMAYLGGTAVTGPTGWWAALAVDGLAVAAFVAFWIYIEIVGFRLF
jgi:hypothetical protein